MSATPVGGDSAAAPGTPIKPKLGSSSDKKADAVVHDKLQTEQENFSEPLSPPSIEKLKSESSLSLAGSAEHVESAAAKTLSHSEDQKIALRSKITEAVNKQDREALYALHAEVQGNETETDKFFTIFNEIGDEAQQNDQKTYLFAHKIAKEIKAFIELIKLFKELETPNENLHQARLIKLDKIISQTGLNNREAGLLLQKALREEPKLAGNFGPWLWCLTSCYEKADPKANFISPRTFEEECYQFLDKILIDYKVEWNLACMSAKYGLSKVALLENLLILNEQSGQKQGEPNAFSLLRRYCDVLTQSDKTVDYSDFEPEVRVELLAEAVVLLLAAKDLPAEELSRKIDTIAAFARDFKVSIDDLGKKLDTFSDEQKASFQPLLQAFAKMPQEYRAVPHLCLKKCLQNELRPDYFHTAGIHVQSMQQALMENDRARFFDLVTESKLEMHDLTEELKQAAAGIRRKNASVEQCNFLDRCMLLLQMNPKYDLSQIPRVDERFQFELEGGFIISVIEAEQRKGINPLIFVESQMQRLESKFAQRPPEQNTLDRFDEIKATLSKMKKEEPVAAIESNFRVLFDKYFVGLRKAQPYAKMIMQDLGSGNSDDAGKEVTKYFAKNLPLEPLVDQLRFYKGVLPPKMQEGIDQLWGKIEKVMRENRRITPDKALIDELYLIFDAEAFRKRFLAADVASREKVINEAFRKQVQVLQVLKELASAEEYERIRSDFETLLVTGLSKNLTEMAIHPKVLLDDFYDAIDRARTNDMDIKDLLMKVHARAPIEAKEYIELVLKKFELISTPEFAEHNLNPYELLRITCVALRELKFETRAVRLKGKKLVLARSVLLDPSDKSFTIISGVHGPVKAQGGQGKIRSIIMVGNEVIDAVRKTGLKNRQGVRRPLSKREIELSKLYLLIGNVVEYTHGTQKKESAHMERYTSDFTTQIAKGKAAFANNDHKMFEGFDQVLADLEIFHTHKDEHGNPSPIVHGDVKSQNILFKAGGRMRLSDFGCSYEYSKEQSNFTGHATIMCSAPEDFKRTHTMDAAEGMAVDMFSIGYMLAETISASERLEGRDPGLWKEIPSKDGRIKREPPWMHEIILHFDRNRPQNIDAIVDRARKQLLQTKHPLAELAYKLLDPNPDTRLTVTQARALLARLKALLPPPPQGS